ncbi:unnamed protein product [Urochloa humidicola]
MDDSGTVFAISGPRHLMAKTGAGSSPTTTIEINWDNEEHRRCITACLVQATYVLESERAKLSEDDDGTCEALAPAWWESFHFRLFRLLACECECLLCEVGRHMHIVADRSPRFIYGAIFEYVPPDGSPRQPSSTPIPRYIVAFRGTMQRDPTTLVDMFLNLKVLLNAQHSCGRFSHARKEVGRLLGPNPSDDEDPLPPPPPPPVVWLAGHSLGASIALDVGRDIMANSELNLPAFLFNPPHVSLGAVISDKLPMAKPVATVLTSMSYIVKYGLGKVLESHKTAMEEQFEQLSPWVPNLYVHQRDTICKGFVYYFEQREQMQEWLPLVAASGTKLSYRDMCRFLFRMLNERPHLLPSAILWENQSPDGNPHELRQWWQPQGPELVLSSKSYKWPGRGAASSSSSSNF